MTADIFEGLNDSQIHAVKAVRGPVCILAGAGSGKTTTITRRIAHQVASGTFQPGQILPVTFTDKAAGEMRARLETLGVAGVRARTFHSAALAQLRALAAEPPGNILPAKGMALRQIANTLPKPYRFRPAADLANEIEWAKNRRLPPERYAGDLGGHEPPIPVDLMQRVYRSYEAGKRDRGLVDFEDLLELAVRMYEEDDYARDAFRERYAAFTVDEYQDVNLLQQSLLEMWLGERDDLCVVGDDYQSIYAFTGASAQHLIDMPARFPRPTVIKLEENYRSTPEVLAVANRLVPKLGGARKVLRATRPTGPAPVLRPFPSVEAEASWIASEVRRLHDHEGVALEEMAVLYRINARSEDYEAALTAAGLPYQVRDGAFLSRAAARALLPTLRKSGATDVAGEVLRLARRNGYTEEVRDDATDQEITRQADLARFVKLAEEFALGGGTAAGFAADVAARFASDGEGRGVNLLTYHRAKGLEFEAVFIVRMEEGEMPFKRARSEEALAEERRLLYVGITRAKRHLHLTWCSSRKPSPFLAELDDRPPQRAPVPSAATGELAALKEWRTRRAREDQVPPYVVFHDATLEEIVRARPRNLRQLASISGIGPTKLERYGPDVLAVLKIG